VRLRGTLGEVQDILLGSPLPKVKSGLFMEAFRNAGRFEPLMRETPVRVILNPKASGPRP
jgi:hypothetical protein